MSIKSIDTPAGGTSGDHYLLHVMSRANTEGVQPPVTVDGFDLLAVSGLGVQWDFLFVRECDETEPAAFTADGVEWFTHIACLLVSGCDPVDPFVAGDPLATYDTAAISPTVDIPAVTTTVDDSVVFFGFATINFYTSGGPTVAAVTELATYGAGLGAVWTDVAPTAGAYGPWTIDRTNEEVGGAQGCVGWSVWAQPVALDPAPVLEAFTTIEGFPDDPPGDAPPSVTITNEYPPYQSATIGGATQTEQDALVQAQRDAWEAEWQADQDADSGDFLAMAADDRTALLAWLDANPTWDPQTRTHAQILARVLHYLIEEATP